MKRRGCGGSVFGFCLLVHPSFLLTWLTFCGKLQMKAGKDPGEGWDPHSCFVVGFCILGSSLPEGEAIERLAYGREWVHVCEIFYFFKGAALQTLQYECYMELF